MSETARNKKKDGHAPHQSRGQVGRPRKNTKPSAKDGSQTAGDFRIGSRDILESPEILSPFDFADETASPAPKRGKKAAPAAEASKPVAPTHNRKSKKKTEEPAPAAVLGRM